MSNTYVFRVNYYDDFRSIRKELLDGRLRQGWGAAGMAVDSTFKAFQDGWKMAWPSEEPDEASQKARYYNLQKMLEIQPGDRIVISKLSFKEDYVVRSFAVVECVTPYRFGLPAGWDDFGHYIGVKAIFSCPYDANPDAMTIANKFKAYQSPLNHVWNKDFQKALDNLILQYSKNHKVFENPKKAVLYHLTAASQGIRKDFLKSLVDEMNKWDSHIFEDIITELFEKNGYQKIRNNDYDGKGGDIDIIFNSFQPDSLMDSISQMNMGAAVLPVIYVQAKKKDGVDNGDVMGVEQLKIMKQKRGSEGEHAIGIVINLTDKYSEAAKKYADDNNIILINGRQFASLLVRFGIGVDVNAED